MSAFENENFDFYKIIKNEIQDNNEKKFGVDSAIADRDLNEFY